MLTNVCYYHFEEQHNSIPSHYLWVGHNFGMLKLFAHEALCKGLPEFGGLFAII